MSASSSLRSAISLSARMAKWFKPPLGRLKPHDQRNVLTAEAERIGNGVPQASITRLVRYHVERNRRIRNGVVDRRGNALVLQREQGEHRLDRTSGRKRVADHGFVGGDRQALHALSKYGRATQIFHLVIFGCAGAVRVDVVDIIWSKTGVVDRVCDASDDRLAVGAGTRAVESVCHFAAALNYAQDFGSACFGGVVALKHQRT